MTGSGRIFLDGGRPKDHNGLGVDLGLSFTSEQDLDHNLWFDPEAAGKNVKFLLKVHQGEMSPTLSRLALKGIALPLFKREFYGDATPVEIEEEIHEIPERNSQLLDAYMDRVGDADIDQTILDQAIDDATALQLVSRSLRSRSADNTILLPTGLEKDHISQPTSFTVLRRQSLGRAPLFVSGVRAAAHINTPEANAHRIQIRPADLLSGGANRYDLAEALIAEQRDAVVSTEDHDLVENAEAHIRGKITRHFDAI
ncbi:MAG: hypothetical protein JWN12_616 [Candidatus Saccharibacteria bacterium]|nr:hypothetical protein [Candidatus Saccharibacteria bacterium]